MSNSWQGVLFIKYCSFFFPPNKPLVIVAEEIHFTLWHLFPKCLWFIQILFCIFQMLDFVMTSCNRICAAVLHGGTVYYHSCVIYNFLQVLAVIWGFCFVLMASIQQLQSFLGFPDLALTSTVLFNWRSVMTFQTSGD